MDDYEPTEAELAAYLKEWTDSGWHINEINLRELYKLDTKICREMQATFHALGLSPKLQDDLEGRN